MKASVGPCFGVAILIDFEQILGLRMKERSVAF